MGPGLASAGVTLALAVILLAVHRAPAETDRAQRTDAAPVAKPSAEPAAPRPVVLPPPPTVSAQTAPQPPDRPTLKPRPRAPEPVSTPVVPLKPPAVEAEPPPKPQAATNTPGISPPKPVAAESVATGRALLRLLETGKGPSVEIAWPSSAGDRQSLYERLSACHGMRTVIVTDEGRIFSADGPAGRAGTLDRDRTSGFVRRPAGATVGTEQKIIRQLQARHGRPAGHPVRLFPRNVDAALLGGLNAAVGPDYMSLRNIRAHYGLRRGAVVIDRIEADGRPVAGAIRLPRAAGSSCG